MQSILNLFRNVSQLPEMQKGQVCQLRQSTVSSAEVSLDFGSTVFERGATLNQSSRKLVSLSSLTSLLARNAIHGWCSTLANLDPRDRAGDY